ncbi:hypothetical protein THAOC_36631, partial [Thalassiosira oceanica]
RALAQSNEAALAEHQRSAESHVRDHQARLDQLEESAARAEEVRREVVRHLDEARALAQSNEAALAEHQRSAESHVRVYQARLDQLEESAARAEGERREVVRVLQDAQSQQVPCNMQEPAMLSSDIFISAYMSYSSCHSGAVREKRQTISAAQFLFQRIESRHVDSREHDGVARNARVYSSRLALDELFRDEYCTEKVSELLLNALDRRMTRQSPLDLILSRRYFGLHVLDQKRLKFVLPLRRKGNSM